MKEEIAALTRQALRDDVPFLELRGRDGLARAGGDIDLLVPYGCSQQACLLVTEEARKAGWLVMGFRSIGYLAQILLVKPGCEDTAVKVDFFSGFAWYGVGPDAISQRFFGLVRTAERKAAELERLAAAANFIQKCLIVGRLSERDWLRVQAGGASPQSLLEICRALNLPISREDIEGKGVSGFRKWRLRAASAGICSPLQIVPWFFRVSIAHLIFKLGIGTGAGLSIGLSGLDGSGKSTQMERLFACFKKAGGNQPRLVHLLPEWIPMPHKLVRRRKTEQNYLTPYAEPPVKSRLNGALRLSYYLLAFGIAKVWMRLATLRGQVTVLDRSFVDFSTDLTRSRIPPFRLPGWLIRFCTPKGIILYLDASPETVVVRKGELGIEKAAVLRDRYLRVIEDIKGRVIDAEGLPEEVFRRVLDELDAVYHTRLKATASKW
ncbi:MAG: hypothetical protein EOM37_12925 [Proteobacteria bacterium]|nr:hypothetical protein [Pseudomonadota bacterium]